MEQSKAMEYESRKASSDVLKPRNIVLLVVVGPAGPNMTNSTATTTFQR